MDRQPSTVSGPGSRHRARGRVLTSPGATQASCCSSMLCPRFSKRNTYGTKLKHPRTEKMRSSSAIYAEPTRRQKAQLKTDPMTLGVMRRVIPPPDPLDRNNPDSCERWTWRPVLSSSVTAYRRSARYQHRQTVKSQCSGNCATALATSESKPSRHSLPARRNRSPP